MQLALGESLSSLENRFRLYNMTDEPWKAEADEDEEDLEIADVVSADLPSHSDSSHVG